MYQIGSQGSSEGWKYDLDKIAVIYLSCTVIIKGMKL